MQRKLNTVHPVDIGILDKNRVQLQVQVCIKWSSRSSHRQRKMGIPFMVWVNISCMVWIIAYLEDALYLQYLCVKKKKKLLIQLLRPLKWIFIGDILLYFITPKRPWMLSCFSGEGTLIVNGGIPCDAHIRILNCTYALLSISDIHW